MWDYLVNLWEKLEIRVLVISSLSIQILLLGLAGFRKHVVSNRYASTTNTTWRGPLALMFHWFLWFTYLMADYVAIVALAYLPKNKDKASPQNQTHHLLMFWAPFFLLHLGGQDTITGLSVEDNDLWSRQLLTMLSQVALASYNYSTSNLQIGELWPPAALMFAVAIFKYGERIWCLQRASMSALRNSMTRKPDPGINYFKFMQVYTAYTAAGLRTDINVEIEKHDDGLQRQKTEAQSKSLEYAEVVRKAYEFFPTFKRLFADLILSYKNRNDSQKFFEHLGYKDAYKLIEIELSWMYDILHSKCSVIYTFKNYGWVSRVITLVITIAALCLFMLSDHTGYGRFETTLTYVLLGGAVGLEILALVFMLLSFWTYATMKESGSCCVLSDFLFSIQKKLRPPTNPRWSDKMAQFNLITYSIENQPCWLMPIMKWIGLDETWDHYQYTTCVTVSEDLKDLVFEELKTMKEDTAPDRGFTAHKGEQTIQRKGYLPEFGWTFTADFDESILLWHIATDLLFHDQKGEQQWEQQSEQQSKSQPRLQRKREISQDISNYMLFLLIKRPFMMPAGMGPNLFGDTCAEAMFFFQQVGDMEEGNMEKENSKKYNAIRRTLEVNTEYDPMLIKGEGNNSVFFKGCMLAHHLQMEFTNRSNGEINWNSIWTLISGVWVEMLCYAASKCSGQFHAKQLSMGGELLTVVWFLMAHMGMGERYQNDQSTMRVKLLTSK